MDRRNIPIHDLGPFYKPPKHNQMGLVKEWVKKGIITGKHLVTDGFPIISFLNTAKCLKLPDISEEDLKNTVADKYTKLPN